MPQWDIISEQPASADPWVVTAEEAYKPEAKPGVTAAERPNPNLARRRTAAERRAQAQPTTFKEIGSEFLGMMNEPALPLSKLAPENPTSYAGNVAKAGLKFAEGMTTPVNVGIIAGTAGLGLLGSAGKAAQKALSLGFSIKMLEDAYERIPEFKTLWDAGEYEKATGVLTSIGLESAASALAVRHSAGIGETTAAPRATPRTPQDVEADRIFPMANEQLAAEPRTPLVNREIATRQRAGAWDVVEEQPVRQNRAQRRASAAPPEEGIANEREVDARGRISQQLTSQPYEQLGEADRRAVDDLVGEGRIGEEPRESAPTIAAAPPEQIATAEIPPTVDNRAPLESREPQAVPVYGRETEIRIPGERKRYKAVYALREAEDVYPSHNPFNFERNEAYQHVNDRNYSEPQAAERIVKQTGEFDPAYLVNDNPTAEQGPPIIDANGNVLGGNSRAMTIARVEQQNPEGIESYRETVSKQAKKFGLDAELASRMKRPVLVRQIVEDLPDAQAAITDFNKVGTAELRQAERAIADSRRVTAKTLEEITTRIEQQGPEATLTQALSGDARPIVERMVDDGVITNQEKPRILNQDGSLTAEGKARVSRLMIGRLFEDARQFDDTPADLRGKLERIVAPLTKTEGVEGWDLTGATKEAVSLLEEARRRDLNIDDLVEQRGMFGPTEHSEPAIAIARKLQGKPTEAARAFRQYAAETELGASRQQLIGVEPPTAGESFQAAFGEGSQAETIVSKLDALEARVKGRIREKVKSAGSTLSAGPGLAAELLADYAALGAVKIAKGAVKFKDWSAEMTREFGEAVKPHLGRIWMRAQVLYRAELAEGGSGSKPPETLTAVAPEPGGRKGTPATTKTSTPPPQGPVTSPSYEITKPNILKNVSETTRSAMETTLQDFEVRNPERQVVSFADIQREARDLDPRIVAQLDAKKLKAGETLDPAVRFAARETLNGLNQELVQKRKEFSVGSKDMTPAQQAEATRRIEDLEQDARRLVDVLIPTRSQDGRNLTYHRMVAEGSFDVTYWLSRARRSMAIPEGAELPAQVTKDLQEITGRGQEAEANAIRRTRRPVDVRKAAEKQAAEELGPAPKGDRRTVDAAGNKLPTPEERQARYKKRVLELIDEKNRGVKKEVPTSKWELTPEERAAVDADPAVKKARIDLARKLATLEKTGLLDTILAARAAGMLTGVRTHMRNIGGNAAFQALEELSRIPASVVDAGFTVFGKPRSVEGPSLLAVGRSARAAATRGVKEAVQIMREGAAEEDLAKLDYRREVNSGNKVFDKVVNTIFRTLSAEDRIFKVYAFERSLAERMKLAGKTEATDTMRTEAASDALYATFNNPNLAAELWASGKARLRSEGNLGAKALSAAMDLTVPFVRTPANIIARVIDYTPLGGAARAGAEVTRAFKNKGWTPEMQRHFSLAIGRGATGSALLWLGWWMGQQDLMTGVTEEEKGLRDANEAAGRMYGSARFGDKWQRIDSLSPIGNILVLGATLEREGVSRGNLPAVGFAAAKTVMEQPMLQGVSQVSEAISDPARSASRYAASTAGSFVPTAVADVAALTDNVRRDTRSQEFGESVKNALASRIPGLRTTLPPRVDVLGEEEPQEWSAVLNPGIGSRAKESDPVLKALIENRVPVSFSPQKTGETAEEFKARKARSPGAKRKVAEDDAQYRARLKREGQAIRQNLGRLMGLRKFKDADPDERREMMKGEISRVRSRVD